MVKVGHRQHIRTTAPQLDWDVARYQLSEAAEAAGVSAWVLRAWVSRRPIIILFGKHDREPSGKGSARLFTARRVLATAIVRELVSLGFAPARAGPIALRCTDAKQSDPNWLDRTLIFYPGTEKWRICWPDNIPSVSEIVAECTVRCGGASFAAVSVRASAEKVRAKLIVNH